MMATSEAALRCESCNLDFDTQYESLNHARLHEPNTPDQVQYRCEPCALAFDSNAKFVDHQRTAHTT
jgi:hypothetical protein